MPLLLHLESATEVCSVCISSDDKIISLKESTEGREHASKLTVFIADAVKEAGIKINQLDGISLSKGPGSYTGLRIGSSVAKGLCYTLGIPLIAIDTLFAMASVYKKDFQLQDDAFMIPMIDARRMEVYTSVLNRELIIEENSHALILDEKSFKDYEGRPKIIFGDGAGKASQWMKNWGMTEYNPDFKHSSTGLILASQQAWKDQRFEDVAYFEPAYLKEFAGKTGA